MPCLLNAPFVCMQSGRVDVGETAVVGYYRQHPLSLYPYFQPCTLPCPAPPPLSVVLQSGRVDVGETAVVGYFQQRPPPLLFTPSPLFPVVCNLRCSLVVWMWVRLQWLVTSSSTHRQCLTTSDW